MLDNSLAPLLDRIRAIPDETAVNAFVKSLCDVFDVTQSAYFLMQPDGHTRVYGTFPQEWIEGFFANGLDRHDPIVLACFNRYLPIDWQDLDWSSRQAQMIYQFALEHGLGPNGYTVPIRGPRGQYAALSLCAGGSAADWREKWEGEMSNLMTICQFLNARILEIDPTLCSEPRKALSPREVDAMSFLARGMSRAQIAVKLDISEHTLRAYIESARRKLDATNTTHAVAKAIAHGFILV
ncbi:autoinducer binding domain-containing protein [Donghicola sp. XS_ASV15]|uniref:helix-turn-helix transcriptional regulator n=1 Tax=Donghicola sp. XS_ASV15 TaxID=3241295 RepID=UPI003515B337